jgi:hypothetical protein
MKISIWMASIPLICASAATSNVLADCSTEELAKAQSLFLARDYYHGNIILNECAEKGNAVAQFALARSYEKGEGVGKDTKLAITWYTKAAEQNLIDAQFNLANLYSSGGDLQPDIAKAIFWFEKAASQGDASAAYNLGHLYQTAKKDEKLTLFWWEKAAKMGHKKAAQKLKTRGDNPREQNKEDSKQDNSSLAQPSDKKFKPRTFKDPLPSPPPGFKWFLCEEMHTSLLLPSSWFFKKELHGDTTAYFISKEKIEAGGEFRTGLTVNFLRNFSKNHKGEMPVSYARRFIEALKKEGKEVKSWSALAGKGISYGTQVIMKLNSSDPYRIHTFAAGNDWTDSLYLFTFEAPEADWLNEVSTARVFIDSLALDDEL